MNRKDKNMEYELEEKKGKGTGTGAEAKAGAGEGKKDQEVLHRLSATREADEALSRIVDRVNDGFNGGRVTRMQALSWLLIRQADSLPETTILEIRAEFFDEVALLESILRQAKATGKVPNELRGLLQKQLGLEDQPKKKAKKQIDE